MAKHPNKHKRSSSLPPANTTANAPVQAAQEKETLTAVENKTEARANTMKKTSPRKSYNTNGKTFLFDSTNYKWMIAGVVLILVGFMLMSGGKNADPNVFDFNEIYSFRRVTLAPLVVLLGFGVEFYAIMRKPSLEKH